MTTNILTATGEEYVSKNALDGTTITWGLYYDSTDAFDDTTYDPSAAISTEPGNANYGRVTTTVSAAQTSTDVWGVQNDSSMSFDFSDTTASDKVDAVFCLVNFNSAYAGSTGDWIIASAGLTNSHTIGNVNSIDIAAGDLELNFS